MSVNEQINRIKTNISDAYSTLETKGATLPTVENSNDLDDTINTLNVGITAIDLGISKTITLNAEEYIVVNVQELNN